MNKIKTIFKRDLQTRKVINEKDVNLYFENIFATEKINGTNIRVTIRSGVYVRIEVRNNPTKIQKQEGILNPWYRDANIINDKWVIKAVENTDFFNIEDGEWSGEAYGKKIQGNDLELNNQKVFLFSHNKTLESIILYDCPIKYNEIKEYLINKKSVIGDGLIEGIVYYNNKYEAIGKIKLKDFKY
jgi:hypothetical protein